MDPAAVIPEDYGSGVPALRAALPEDVDQIVPLLDQLGYPTSAADVRTRLARLDADPGGSVLVAVEGGDLVGLATTHLRSNLQREGPTCRLTALVVDASARGQGVGRELLEAVVADAERQGCERVEVTLRPERQAAEALYRSAGFEERPLRLIRPLRRG
jgi:ribosomal protein S18 acetylase RimI-like enzyme